jgi:cell division protein FtsN
MATSMRRRTGSGPGSGQWLMLGGGLLVVLVLTFALGLLVGRQWARPASPAASPSVSEAARKATAPPARRGGIAADTMADRGPEPTEKLTFYQTLTEPLVAQGASPRPEPKTVAIKPSPAPSAAPAPASVPPAAATPAAPPVAAPPPAPSKAPAAAAATGPPWTIQVAAFKNRKQADDMRQQLASSGLDAYVATLADGHARYRVRVGTFKSRDEAAAAAERLRGSRSLNVFVTLK